MATVATKECKCPLPTADRKGLCGGTLEFTEFTGKCNVCGAVFGLVWKKPVDDNLCFPGPRKLPERHPIGADRITINGR